MQYPGISYAEFEFLFFNAAILAGWPLLAVLTLFGLRRRSLAPTPQALWTLMIIAIPFLGALAFWIVRPGGVPDRPSARPQVLP